MILTSKTQICDELGIGPTVFDKWREREVNGKKFPVFFDGRAWVGYKEDIEVFMAEYIVLKTHVNSDKHP